MRRWALAESRLKVRGSKTDVPLVEGAAALVLVAEGYLRDLEFDQIPAFPQTDQGRPRIPLCDDEFSRSGTAK